MITMQINHTKKLAIKIMNIREVKKVQKLQWMLHFEIFKKYETTKVHHMLYQILYIFKFYYTLCRATYFWNIFYKCFTSSTQGIYSNIFVLCVKQIWTYKLKSSYYSFKMTFCDPHALWYIIKSDLKCRQNL